MVDERDFMILAGLRRNPFSSYESLGRVIGLSGSAVKSRIEAMEKAKVLTGLRAMPAAQVFRRRPRLFFFKRPATPENLARALEAESAVFGTLDVDHRAAVLLYESSPSSPDDLSSILGPPEIDVTPLFPYSKKELPRLSAADLRVLRELISDLRLPVKRISESTGLSQKVVKKARKRLLDEGLMQVQPVFQSAKSSRVLMYELHVFSNDNAVLSRIKQTLPKSMFVNQWEDTAVIFSCWAESIAEVFESEARVRSTPGVTGSRVKFHSRTTLCIPKLMSWIDNEIGRLETEKPSGPRAFFDA